MLRLIIAILILIASAFGFAALFSGASCAGKVDHSADMASAVISAENANIDLADWGTFTAHFTGDTYGTKGTLAGVADIKAGQQIHPPHRHGDEEFLLVTQGQGTWHLNGRDFPAKAGDMLYAAPWDYHGVSAAPGSDLQFVVFKWSNKGVATPADPDPSLPEELAQ